MTPVIGMNLCELDHVSNEALHVSNCTRQIDRVVHFLDDIVISVDQLSNRLCEVVGVAMAENVDDLLPVADG